MACAITGRVTESTTGAPLTTPSLALHRVGVVGETPTILGENGRFRSHRYVQASTLCRPTATNSSIGISHSH